MLEHMTSPDQTKKNYRNQFYHTTILDHQNANPLNATTHTSTISSLKEMLIVQQWFQN
jgi:hypothetical protein